jgi:hypothetical protein
MYRAVSWGGPRGHAPYIIYICTNYLIYLLSVTKYHIIIINRINLGFMYRYILVLFIYIGIC